MRSLRDVFQKLCDGNLDVYVEKSEFLKAKVEYSGYVVGKGFLGMPGYYRRFCIDFLVIALAMTKFLSNKEIFVWHEPCNNSFQ